MKKDIREIVFDTETTGFYYDKTDRLIEIGAIELINHIPTGRTYHSYINPQRDVPEAAYKIHKLSTEFLRDKALFSQVYKDFLDFIGDDTLIAHNASFDMNFINAELKRIGEPTLENKVIDTLTLARRKFPSARSNSLDALCNRFGISLAQRNKDGHGALLDSEILAKVYIELIGGKEINMFAETEQKKDKKKEKKVVKTKKIKREFKAAREFKLKEKELETHNSFIKNLDTDAIWNKRL
ncbi:MAG: DNA polymerase III subunit epsilon [Alphaproteobacteria bacterium]|jgi:DNA polymerase-3 subunit epsilon|nr:DNA polymerase III subunit epsilon [Alphaproteobacteria bacterium]